MFFCTPTPKLELRSNWWKKSRFKDFFEYFERNWKTQRKKLTWKQIIDNGKSKREWREGTYEEIAGNLHTTCLLFSFFFVCFTPSQYVPPSSLSLSDWVWLDFGVEALDLGVPNAEVFRDYGSKDVDYERRGYWWLFFYCSSVCVFFLFLEWEVHWFCILWF